MAVSLTEWLGSRTPGEIAAILAVRPDATAPPVPRHLRDLAERLEIFHSVADAVHTLPRPALEVVEVLQLLGRDGGERAALARWLGRAADDPDLAAVLNLLASHALVWEDGDHLRMAAPLYATFRSPLRLGSPAAVLLAPCPAEQLRRIARNLDVPSQGRKDALVSRIAAALSDAERVRALLATAPAGTREALERLAAEGPPVAEFSDWYGYYQYQADPDLHWGTERGLVVTVPPGLPQLPREVALAMRGPQWCAPFTPAPPASPITSVDAATVDREAAAAAAAAVEQLTSLLEAISASPVSMLKTGGVGVRELRRLAKVVGADEEVVRLWLELVYEAELVAPAEPAARTATGGPGSPSAARAVSLLPTEEYDAWSTSQPAERLAALLPVWAGLPAAPLAQRSTEEPKPPPALIRDHSGHLFAAVRAAVLRYAATLPPGKGLADEEALPAAVQWLCPLLLDPLDGAAWLVHGAAREARLLGVMAHGVLGPMGLALTGEDPAALDAACRRLLPAATERAIFQADLTAVVPGTPERALAELLDSGADRETRGGAVTWRFSAGSVRRALDGGYQARQLLAELRERALGGTLPQPLEYLVADVARRHGAVRVRPVACVLRAEDPALLAEIASARTLRSLRLSVIAPTVLASAASMPDTLAALRQAGYAPVGESEDGTPVMERVERQRARPAGATQPTTRRQPVPRPRVEDPSAVDPADPMAMASALLAAPVPPPAPAPARAAAGTDLAALERQLLAQGFLGLTGGDEADEDLTAALARMAAHLAPGELRLLAHAIEHSQPVEISYTNAQGGRSRRVIEPLELDGPQLVAWCQLRDSERVFALHRIGSVAPAWA